MNTEHLQYVLTIAQYGSINQAAEVLHLQRSYLSRIVSNLEQQLGVAIFKRVPKGVITTPEGVYVLDKLTAALNILQELEQHFAVQQEDDYSCYHDQITLYTPLKMRPRHQMIRVIEEYQQQFPNVSLVLVEKSGQSAYKDLQGQKNHIAMTVHSEKIAHLDWPIPEQLCFLQLKEMPLVALAAKNNVIAESYQSISLATLCKEDMILMQADDTLDDKPLFYDLLEQYGKPNVKHVVGSNIALFHELLETGRYFSLGTIHAGGGSLKEIPLKEAITMKAGLLFDETVLKNFPAKVLIEKIVERIGNADEVQFRGKCKGKL